MAVWLPTCSSYWTRNRRKNSRNRPTSKSIRKMSSGRHCAAPSPADKSAASESTRLISNSKLFWVLTRQIAGHLVAVKLIWNFLGFLLDADSLDPLEVSGRGWNSSLTTISLYSVIGCIIVLVIIAIIQASCTIYKVSRKSPSSVNKVR